MFDICTQLYNLKPIGLNTGLVESQTSYLARLSETHSVSVGTLIGKVIAPVLGKGYLLESSSNGGSRFYDVGAELNGFGILSQDIVRVLSQLTGCNTLKSLTLLPLREILTNGGTLRQTKAWCPLCLEEWKNGKLDIYEPLLWSVKAVSICGNHGISLKTQCPMCKKEIPFLSRKSRNGFCSYCGCWLGTTDLKINEEINFQQTSLEYFVANNMKILLEMKDNPTFSPSAEDVYVFLSTIIDNAGGRIAFSRKFGIPLTTARYWYEGRHIPYLKTLLEICYKVCIDINELSKENQTKFGSISRDNVYALPGKQNKTVFKKGSYDWSRVEKILQDIISNEIIPFPSVCEVARYIQCDKKLLYRHFPNLCKEISKKHSSFIHKQKMKRIDEGCQRIKETTKILNDSGVYPSRRKIESLLPSNIQLREKAYQKAWKESLDNLSLNNPSE